MYNILGAIIGDYVGSRFELVNYKGTDFDFYHKDCKFTDDTIMTVAICKAIMDCNRDWTELGNYTIEEMQYFGRKYPRAGYGKAFKEWINSKNPRPYNSYGNGAAMRISPVAYVSSSIQEVKTLSHIITATTHNHEESFKGAEAIAVATFMGNHKFTKEQIKTEMSKYYSLDFNIDDIRDSYKFNNTCEGSVPQAIKCFLESENFGEAIRLAVSIGGDSDTIAAMTGSIAGAFYNVPIGTALPVINKLDEELLFIVKAFAFK